jgi:hypothetical protein
MLVTFINDALSEVNELCPLSPASRGPKNPLIDLVATDGVVLTVPFTVWLEGKLLTLTVPLTCCVPGWLATLTWRLPAGSGPRPNQGD